MTERWLPVAEWGRVRDRFTRRGADLPHPSLAKIRVVEDDGAIVAMLVGQLVPHCEPLEIDEAYRGKVWWPAMLAEVEAEFPGVYVFAPNDQIAALAESQGLTRLPWAVFHREVVPCHS